MKKNIYKFSVTIAVVLLVAAGIVVGQQWQEIKPEPDKEQAKEQTKNGSNDVRNGEKDGENNDERNDEGNGEAIDKRRTDDVSYYIKDNTITLSWGEKPTGGYDVTIEKMEIKDKELQVYYSLISPAPGNIVTQVITYPEDSAAIPAGAYEEVALYLMAE